MGQRRRKEKNYRQVNQIIKILLLKRQKGVLYDIKWSKNGSLIATVSDDRFVRIWRVNFDSTKIECLFSGMGHEVCVNLTPNATFCVTSL